MNEILSGYVTFVAAVGLVLLGLFKIYQGSTDGGMVLITAGLGLFGLRRAVGSIKAEVAEVKAEVKKVQ